MDSNHQQTGPSHHAWRLSAHALSNTRLALVACTLLATVAVLLVVTLQARGAQDALDEAASHTLRDYSGYASRMLGADVLRRFSEQRSAILAIVIGTSGRDTPPPSLEELTRAGDRALAQLDARNHTALGYYRFDVASARIEGARGVQGGYAVRIADTLRLVAPKLTPGAPPGILALEWQGGGHSVAYAPYYDAHGTISAIYGYTYSRGAGVAAIAEQVFREVPLLPVSFAGVRWNYDTTRVRAGEIANDSLLAMRVSDRRGRKLWETHDAAVALAATPNGARTVISTNAGGIVIDAAMRPAAEPLLIPSIVRHAQRLTLRGLIALALLLVVVSLLALRGERLDAQTRRMDAMQQLSLGLRHEMNNALASVLLNAELLNQEDSWSDEQQERIAAIIEQAERMRKVVRRLEQSDRLDVLVPYLNEGLMVDLSTTRERDGLSEFDTRKRTGS